MTFDELDGRHSHLALDPFGEGYRAETFIDDETPSPLMLDLDDEPTTEFLVMEAGEPTLVGYAPPPRPA